MADRDTLTLTLHGLAAFNKDVDGEVFARKFFKFMQALATADQTANGTRRMKYLIEKLEKNTATAAVREQVATEGSEPNSGIEYFERGAEWVYHDRPEARTLPTRFVAYLQDIASGVGTSFDKGIIKHSANDNAVPIDANFEANTKRVLDDIKRLSLGRIQPFAGQAKITLDGRLVTLEGRGAEDRAIVILTAGGQEIDCHVQRIPEERLRELWKQRCTVRGVGHYSGNRRLPDWIDAMQIDPVPNGGDWTVWRGSIERGSIEEDGWN